MVLFGEGGVCGFIGGHAWFYLGGMHGFIWGACMVLFGGRYAWFYSGGMPGFIWGVCVVLFGGHAWFYLGGMCGFIWGACMVLLGGMLGFIRGVCGFIGGRACFFRFFRYNEIRSMSGWYAFYWNAFLFVFNYFLPRFYFTFYDFLYHVVLRSSFFSIPFSFALLIHDI